MKTKNCGLSLLLTVKAVINMNKSTVPISIISKVDDLWYTLNKKYSTTAVKCIHKINLVKVKMNA